MNNSASDTEQPVRDQLALVRTKLANERTLLAYIRTAIMFAATGATLLKFFHDEFGLRVLGWVSIALAILIVIYGVAKYRRLSLVLETPSNGAEQ